MDKLRELLSTRWGVVLAAAAVFLVVLGVVGYFWDEGELRPTGEEVWVTYQDPHGFSVSIPESWQVAIDDWGLVRIGPAAEEKEGAVAFMVTMNFFENRSNEQVLEAVLPDLQETFPGLQIKSSRALTDYQSLVCQIEYGDGGYVGAVLVTTSGSSAFVSGLADERAAFARTRADLLRVLASFQYDYALQDFSQAEDTVVMVPWQDPNEGAFTISVPAGWNVSGGIVRPYIDAWLKIVTTTANKGIQVENLYPPMYATPNWVLEMAGLVEGSHYNPSGGISQDMIVMGEKSAEQYIASLLPSYLGLSLEGVMSRPDLVEKVPKMPWTTSTTAAEGVLGGDGLVHKVVVIEQGLDISGSGLWAVVLVHYWAPEDEIGFVEEIIAAMRQSFVIDPVWAAREQAEVAKRIGIINQAGSEIADIIASTFDYQSRVQDRAMRQWSNAMLGIERVYNPATGETYEVPNTAVHYWSDGSNIVGTYVSEPPTYYDNWIELFPAE